MLDKVLEDFIPMSRIFEVLADEGYKCDEDGLIGLMADKAFRLVFPYQGKIWIPANTEAKKPDSEPDWKAIWAHELACYDQEPAFPQYEEPVIFFDIVGPGEVIDYDGCLAVPVSLIKGLHATGGKPSNIKRLSSMERIESPGVMVRCCVLSELGLEDGFTNYEYYNLTKNFNFGVLKNDLIGFLNSKIGKINHFRAPEDEGHISKKLSAAIWGAEEIWQPVKKDEPWSHPKNSEVAIRLMAKFGFEKTVAARVASIIRPDWARLGAPFSKK